jgi:hypothetical protein
MLNRDSIDNEFSNTRNTKEIRKDTNFISLSAAFFSLLSSKREGSISFTTSRAGRSFTIKG